MSDALDPALLDLQVEAPFASLDRANAALNDRADRNDVVLKGRRDDVLEILRACERRLVAWSEREPRPDDEAVFQAKARSGDPPFMGLFQRMGYVARGAGWPEVSVAFFQRAREDADREGRGAAQCEMRCQLALSHIDCGRLSAARLEFQSAKLILAQLEPSPVKTLVAMVDRIIERVTRLDAAFAELDALGPLHQLIIDNRKPFESVHVCRGVAAAAERRWWVDPVADPDRLEAVWQLRAATTLREGLGESWAILGSLERACELARDVVDVDGRCRLAHDLALAQILYGETVRASAVVGRALTELIELTTGPREEPNLVANLHLAALWGLRCRIETALVNLDQAPECWIESALQLQAARARVSSEADEKLLEWVEPRVYDGMIALAERLRADFGWTSHEAISVLAHKAGEHGVSLDLVAHLGKYS